ncbi:substance-P receptor-like [Oculina patagonica]
MANNGSFNLQFLMNSNDSLQKGNTATALGETHFQFLWLLYVAYAVIFLASLFGNSAIIHIIRTDNSMKTTTNYLILNQACADLLITIAELMNAIRYSSMDNLWFGGVLGLITCKFSIAIVFTPPMFSIWILVTIAVERFYAVTRPLRSSPVSQHLKKVILLLWASCLATPASFLKNANFKNLKKSYFCDLAYTLLQRTALNTVTITMNVPLPLLIIAVMYTIVCIKLWSRKVPGEGSTQNEQQAEAVKTAKKVTLMMISIVVLYVLCWFPMFILFIFQQISQIQQKGSFLLFIIWLTVTYSALNPYVYLMFSQNFCNGFKNLFRNCTGQITFCKFNILPLRTQSVELVQM